MTATEVQVSRRPWVVLVAMSAAVTIVIFNSSAINVAQQPCAWSSSFTR